MHVTESPGTAAGSSASHTKKASQVPQLSRQLVRKHAVENIIIVSYANAHHTDYALNWVTYLIANNITNYLIGALDHTTGNTLSAAGVNWFALYSDADGSKSLEGAS